MMSVIRSAAFQPYALMRLGDTIPDLTTQTNSKVHLSIIEPWVFLLVVKRADR